MRIKDLLNSDNPYYKVIKNPKIYFYNIGVSTLIVGAITLSINILHTYTSLISIKIPSGVHQLIGFLIAMLLVFRTNTAYDRWWEGRKMLDVIQTKVSIIFTILNSNSLDLEVIRQKFFNLLEDIKVYLKNDEKTADLQFHKKQMESISEIISLFRKMNFDKKLNDQEYNTIIQCINSLIEAVSSCERIKTTPIPFSYYIHIKISIFLYLITLPFSLFADMHLWSTAIVMVLYFLISGVEIISSEIENPFSDDPNDLPVDNIIDNIKKII